MNKLIFLSAALFFLMSTSSCQNSRSCGPGTVWSDYANGGMGGCVPYNGNTNGGNSTLVAARFDFAFPMDVQPSTDLAYMNSFVSYPTGTGLHYLAETYPGTNWVSGQYRQMMITRNGQATMAIANQDLENRLAMEADTRQLVETVKSLLGNRTALQQYADREVPIVTYAYGAGLLGATNYNPNTNELCGIGIFCKVNSAIQWKKVRDLYYLF
jgi:hypothetical protein